MKILNLLKAILVEFLFYRRNTILEIENTKIFYDKFGVPHIYSLNEENLFFALGYIQAQDRLFQMDLLKKASKGELFNFFGRCSLDIDVFAKSLNLEKISKKTYENLPKNIKILLLKFTEGINAYIKKMKDKLPLEYILLEAKPDNWNPYDPITLYKGIAFSLSGFSINFLGKLEYYLLAKKFGFENLKKLRIFERPLNTPTIKNFNQDGGETFLNKNIPNLDERGICEVIRTLSKFSEIFGIYLGSNAWVVNKEKSYSEKPILAADPHLSLLCPPILYEAHLILENKFNIRGVLFPGTPFLIEGWNEYFSWGATLLFGADIVDFYYYKFDETYENYLYKGKWEKLKKEKFKILGKEYEVSWTKHGIILDKYNLKLGFSWIGFEETYEVLGSYKLLYAKNLEDFRESLKYHTVPPVNIVYADIEGNIAYFAVGKIPKRRNFSIFPLNGSIGEGEWEDFITFNEMPHVINPKENFLITANNKPVGLNYPYYLGFNWWDRYRYERIEELIRKKKKIDIKYFEKMQKDNFSFDAKIFVPYIIEAIKNKTNKKMALVRNYLLNWDFLMKEGEIAPTIYNMWIKKIQEIIWDKKYKKYNLESFIGKYPPLETLEIILSENLKFFLNDKGRDEIIIEALDEALKELEKNFGKNLKKWKWKNRCRISHILGKYLKFLNYPEITLSAGGHTISPLLKFDSFYGGSCFRQIVDLSTLEGKTILAGGQSGHRFNKFWKNQLKLWVKGKYKKATLHQKNF